jgi:phage tail-like protein
MPISGNGGTRTAQRVDPFATFKFGVEVEGIIEAEFTECSGLEIANDVFEYQEGGLNEYSHKFPGRTKLSNITLKRGFATSNELFNWYSEMRNGLLADNVVTNRKVTITLYSTADQDELMRWSLNEAFPVKWVGPAFKTGEAAAAIETLEFAHHGIIVDE